MGNFLNSFRLIFPFEKDFKYSELESFLSPFSWNHVYKIEKLKFYTWNIVVPKMYIIMLEIFQHSKHNVLFYDGPDFHTIGYKATPTKLYIAKSFQIYIMYLGNKDNCWLARESAYWSILCATVFQGLVAGSL